MVGILWMSPVFPLESLQVDNRGRGGTCQSHVLGAMRNYRPPLLRRRKGVVPKGWGHLRRWKRQGDRFSLWGLQRGRQPCQRLGFSPLRPILVFWLGEPWNHKHVLCETTKSVVTCYGSNEIWLPCLCGASSFWGYFCPCNHVWSLSSLEKTETIGVPNLRSLLLLRNWTEQV